MADELSDADEREEFFYELDVMIARMHELFTEHEGLVADYDRAMRYMETRDGWREAYVQRMAERRSVEGTGDDDE